VPKLRQQSQCVIHKEINAVQENMQTIWEGMEGGKVFG
jgi:hypothetical protein